MSKGGRTKKKIMLAILLKMVLINNYILHTKKANHGDATILKGLSLRGGSQGYQFRRQRLRCTAVTKLERKDRTARQSKLHLHGCLGCRKPQTSSSVLHELNIVLHVCHPNTLEGKQCNQGHP